MNIIWGKWVLEHLPEVLRTPVMYAFCMTFTYPVRTLYNEFAGWKEKMRIKAGGSPQVCMLQKSVKDSLGIDIVIEEYDGKPYDFIVKTKQVSTDKDRQLAALLDRYKLAGKSYKYENGAVKWNAEWGEFVEEICVTTGTWGGFVHVILNPIPDPDPDPIRVSLNVIKNTQSVAVTASSPVNSRLTINYTIDFEAQKVDGEIGGGSIGTIKSSITLEKGSSFKEEGIPLAVGINIAEIIKVRGAIGKDSEEDKTEYQLEIV